MSAFSIGRTTSSGKTGVVLMEPGIGSFQVLSIASMFLLVVASTNVYASINVR